MFSIGPKPKYPIPKFHQTHLLCTDKPQPSCNRFHACTSCLHRFSHKLVPTCSFAWSHAPICTTRLVCTTFSCWQPTRRTMHSYPCSCQLQAMLHVISPIECKVGNPEKEGEHDLKKKVRHTG